MGSAIRHEPWCARRASVLGGVAMKTLNGLAVIWTLAVVFVQPAAAALQVFACEPEWATLTEELGGTAVSVTSATTGLQDPHRIQARPSLIAKVRRADLIVCTGADLEVGWLPMLLRQAGNARVLPGQAGYFQAADHVTMLDVPTSVDRAAGDVHPAGNPHIHTDPRRIADVAAALVKRLAQIDARNSASYEERYADFIARWQAAVAGWEERAAPLRDMAVVSTHQGWVYLYEWLGLREVATLEPKPGLPASAAHLAAVQQRLQQQPARLIIHAAYQDARPAEWLAERSNLPVVELPFTVGGNAAATNLFALFEDTVSRLLAARE